MVDGERRITVVGSPALIFDKNYLLDYIREAFFINDKLIQMRVIPLVHWTSDNLALTSGLLAVENIIQAIKFALFPARFPMQEINANEADILEFRGVHVRLMEGNGKFFYTRQHENYGAGELPVPRQNDSNTP